MLGHWQSDGEYIGSVDLSTEVPLRRRVTISASGLSISFLLSILGSCQTEFFCPMKKQPKGNLPNTIVIGAEKCGTTSLHYYLSLHPEIYMSAEKELNFFIAEGNWHKGIDWYRSNFRMAAPIIGESSPLYTAFPKHQGVPERMHALIPDARLIYMVRDPIDRIISHYTHEYSIGKEHRTIQDTLSNPESNLIVLASNYYLQLEQYLKYYSKSCILIIPLEHLSEHRIETLKKIFRFLEVDDSFVTNKFEKIIHSSQHKGRKNRLGLLLKWMSDTRLARLFPTHFRMALGEILYRPFTSRVLLPEFTEGLTSSMRSILKEDIDRFREVSGYRLSSWRI